jgi:hypothetical protein
VSDSAIVLFHNGLLWFLLSLLLGPIATFLIVALCGGLPDSS